MRVAVTTPYFDFYPELKAQFAALYPGVKFRSDRHKLTEDELIDYLRSYDAALIGLDRFTDRVCAALPELKIVSLCSAGVDHIDPAILKAHGKKMYCQDARIGIHVFHIKMQVSRCSYLDAQIKMHLLRRNNVDSYIDVNVSRVVASFYKADEIDASCNVPQKL